MSDHKSPAHAQSHSRAHAHGRAHAHAQRPKSQPAHVISFVSAHAADARNISARTGVPTEVILAQSALESNWGRKVIGNAYFGIKGKSASGKSTRFATHEETRSGQRVSEVDEFRAFANYAEAAEDYASLIMRRYSGAMAYKSDPMKFAEAVARLRYATDSAHGAKLKSILRLHVMPLMVPTAAPAAQPEAEHATP
ncbi:glycoside hydrolase family 73 protein [Aquabacterium sp.]|uniref:glycoside hydrolase family 73 protein n=1 Tax=Aquabacterium sp. TaxID=1872578 RepID=UPI003784E74F